MSSKRNVILTAQSGPREGSSFVIQQGQTRKFGREPGSSDVAFKADNSMSREHFEISNYGDRAEIKDLKSLNKTWLNKSIISTATIEDKDVIRAGKSEFLVEWESLPEIVQAELVEDQDEDFSDAYSQRPKEDFESLGGAPSNNVPVSRLPIDEVAVGAQEQSLEAESEVVGSYWDESTDAPGDSEGVEWLEQPTQTTPVSKVSKDNFDQDVESDLEIETGVDVDQTNLDRGTDESVDEIAVGGSEQNAAEPIWLYKELSDDFSTVWDLLGELSVTETIFVVVHFRKIAQETPKVFQAMPVFPAIPKSAHFLPVVVDCKNWLKHSNPQVTKELLQNDGLLLVVGRSLLNTYEYLRSLEGIELPNFSKAGGFLGWCWPSQLATIIRTSSQKDMMRLVSHEIRGFVFRADTDSGLRAYVDPGLETLLKRLGFE